MWFDRKGEKKKEKKEKRVKKMGPSIPLPRQFHDGPAKGKGRKGKTVQKKGGSGATKYPDIRPKGERRKKKKVKEEGRKEREPRCRALFVVQHGLWIMERGRKKKTPKEKKKKKKKGGGRET